MSVLAAVEDALLERLEVVFDERLREIAHKPARLDNEELARVLTMAPSAYCAFLGFTAAADLPDGTYAASWGVYLLARNASGEPARRRGTSATIGAYEMVAIATAGLDGRRLRHAAGEASVQRCENLFATAWDKAGVSAYALVLTVPVEMPEAPAALGDFIRFQPGWDVPPHTGRPDVPDRIILPAA